jgi:hypothetical protein
MKPSIDESVLMQYATPLSDEYDIEKLNGRIKEVAPAFDNYPGMFFKLYAVNAAGPQVIQRIQLNLFVGWQRSDAEVSCR